MIADRSTNPYTVGIENTSITLELVIPALLAVLVQWGLVRRRWLRAAAEDDFTRWPWIATAVAGLVVLNPFGLAFLQASLQHSASDFMWQFTATVTGAGLAALLVMAWIECYIRDRILNRRLAASPSPHRNRQVSRTATARRKRKSERLSKNGDGSGRVLRHHHHRLGTGRLCHRHPCGAAWLQDRDRRARFPRRHLLELGLHPDQGAAALGRDLPLHAARQGLRAQGGQRRLRSGRRDQALARRRRPHERRRRLPDEEEQGFGDLGRGHDRRARQDHREGQQDARAQGRARPGHLSGQAHHRRDRRAAALRCRDWSPTRSWSGPISRR